MKTIKAMTADEFIRMYPFLRAVNIWVLVELALERGIVLSTLKKEKEL